MVYTISWYSICDGDVYSVFVVLYGENVYSVCVVLFVGNGVTVCVGGWVGVCGL